ncbi:MAG: hypothetical protein ACFCD0_11490 [Gemmataceae bacterium]
MRDNTNAKNGEGGIRTLPVSPDVQPILEEDGAESGALESVDPELALVMEAWPTLPEGIRAGILAMIRGARD